MAISTAPTVPNNDVVLGTTGLWYVESASKGFSFFGTVSDAPAANKNNYQPFGGANATLWNIGPTANISITGIVGGFGNTGLILFTNTSTTYTITLPALSGSSSGANQFINSATVGPGVSVLLIYNSFNWSIVGVPGTGASGTVTSVGLSSSDFTVSGSPVTVSGTITANLATQAGVTAGSYTNSNVTVNSKGIITAISSGSAGGVTSVSATAPIQTSGSTGAITLSAALFGTSNSGVVPASGGGTTNYLRADGTWAAPPGTGISSITGTAPITASTTSGATTVGFTVPGSTTQFIWNNGGVLAGSAILAETGTNQISFGTGVTGTTTTLTMPAPAATSNGATLFMLGAPGGATSGAGGGLSFRGGAPTSGAGGSVSFYGGNGAGTLGNGGQLTFQSGTGLGAGAAGGPMLFQCGNGPNSGAGGNGGGLTIAAGGGYGAGNFGGTFNATAGAGLLGANAGSLVFAGGSSTAAGSGGAVSFTSGSSVSGTAGSIYFFVGGGGTPYTTDGHIEFISYSGGLVEVDVYGNIVLGAYGSANSQTTQGAGSAGAFVDQSNYYVTPGATGTTVTVPIATSSLTIVPAAAYAAMTVKFPPSPLDGQWFEVQLVNFGVTTMTWEDSGGTAANVLGPPTSTPANSGWGWKYNSTLSKWIRRF